MRRLLTGSRLLTLTGVGGAGKTRLALRVARDVGRAFGDGVWFVDLIQTPAAGLLAQEMLDVDALACLVMTCLGIRRRGGSPMSQVIDHLGHRQALLVLDNCEHLLPGCGRLVGGLLRACAGLRVLATSREPLGVAGETLVAVPPLSMPARGSRPGQVARSEAVELFVARARAVVPDFTLADADGEAVAEVCRRVDGLPLAIELAAARTRLLTPRQILGRLDDRFALLSVKRRAVPARQQTLRACIEWSFDLCDKPERLLWARLAVFVDGFTLDAVEAVCADDELPVEEVMDLVAGLVDKSIVECGESVDRRVGQRRYRMLETIRDFGWERLADTGDEAELRRRHRDWCQELADRATAEWVGDRQAYWYARLTAERANIRAAIEFCLTEPVRGEAAMRLLVGLPQLYWWSRGMAEEGHGWLTRALADATDPTALRARALVQAANFATWQGDQEAVRRLLDEGQHLAERFHDRAVLAFAAFVRTHTALHRNEVSGSRTSVERGLALLPSASAAPDLALRLALLLTLAGYEARDGEHAGAKRHHHEVLAVTEPVGESLYRCTAIWGLGLMAWQSGDDAEARERTAEAIRIERAFGREDRYLTTLSVEVLAWVAARRQRYARAATLLGVVAALVHESGSPLPAMLDADHDSCERQTRAGLGDAAFDAAVERGRLLAVEDALAYAVDDRRAARAAPTAAREAAGPLTRREQQIAELVARGLSNKEIAAALVIARRTAESHVEHILTKLGFTNRSQIAAWIAAGE